MICKCQDKVTLSLCSTNMPGFYLLICENGIEMYVNFDEPVFLFMIEIIITHCPTLIKLTLEIIFLSINFPVIKRRQNLSEPRLFSLSSFYCVNVSSFFLRLLFFCTQYTINYPYIPCLRYPDHL